MRCFLAVEIRHIYIKQRSRWDNRVEMFCPGEVYRFERGRTGAGDHSTFLWSVLHVNIQVMPVGRQALVHHCFVCQVLLSIRVGLPAC